MVLTYFSKASWELIRPDVIKTVKSFFSSGKMLREANRTFITLIPKSENSKSVKIL